MLQLMNVKMVTNFFMKRDVTMITVVKEELAGIPALHVVTNENMERPLPLFIFWHGFTSAKEHNLHYAYLLAGEGYRVIMPEAEHHGERHQGIPDDQRSLSFWEIVIKSIHETEEVVSALKQRSLVESSDIAMAGVSMGAIITLGALTQYNWVKTAASFMGTPAYEDFVHAQIERIKKESDIFPFSKEELDRKKALINNYDLSKQPEALQNRDLFFWHGAQDTVVPIDGAKSFAASHKNADNLTFVVDAQAGHHVNREGILSFISWLKNRQPLKMI
jgi:uncharacterized protein